jgi:Protein of unknown function (DUF3309)
MLTLLILLVPLALLFGGWGASRGYGYTGWSPLGLLLLVLVVLALTGDLSF